MMSLALPPLDDDGDDTNEIGDDLRRPYIDRYVRGPMMSAKCYDNYATIIMVIHATQPYLWGDKWR